MGQKFMKSLYCPGCKKPLITRTLMDPYFSGWQCGKGHRFCLALKHSENDCVDRAGKLKPKYPAGLTLEEKVKFWFEDETCRSHLFYNIAIMVRRIYEITVEGDTARKQPSYQWCPICAGDFVGTFPTVDGHRTGCICQNGHRFGFGGEMISDDDQGICLKAEPDWAEIKTYTEAYVQKRYARCVPKDLREFMMRYLQRGRK